MQSPEFSDTGTYSEDFSDDQHETSFESSLLQTEEGDARNKGSDDTKVSTDCSCQTDLKSAVVYAAIGKTALIYKRTSICPQIVGIEQLTDDDADPNRDASNVLAKIKSHRRLRKVSEPPRKSQIDTSHQRSRTQQPQNSKVGKQKGQIKGNAKSNATQTGCVATRRLLSARKLRIDDLRNQIMDLERQLMSEQRENKILRNLYNRQQKELNKVEESRVEIPDLEKAHDEEMRSLKTLMRKCQEKNKELELKLRIKDEEMQRRFNIIQNLKATLQERKRIEDESEKKLHALTIRIAKRDETIAKLKGNLTSSERKMSEDRKSHENAKTELKNLKKKYEDVKKTSGERKHMQQNAVPTSSLSGNASPKIASTPVENDKLEINLTKFEEAAGDQTPNDKSSNQKLNESSSSIGKSKNEPDINILKEVLSKALTSANQPAVTTPTDKTVKSEQCNAVNVKKLSSPSELSMRINNRMRLQSDDKHIPLIIPTRAPRMSNNQSDSSCTGSYSEEYIDTSHKTMSKTREKYLTKQKFNKLGLSKPS